LRGLVPIVPEGAPPYHYLTIRGDRSNPETAYQLRVTAKVPGPDAEVEPNDAPDKAMAVLAERTVVHATWTPGDIDCFVLAADPAARILDVTIDTQGESDLGVDLLVDGKVIATVDHPGKGTAERVTGAVPAGAMPVIRVHGAEASGRRIRRADRGRSGIAAMTSRAPRATQILVVLALINLVSYAARNALFAVYPDLTARYGIDYAEIGFLQTVYMLPHAIATLRSAGRAIATIAAR